MYIIHVLKCLNVIIVHKEVTIEVLERELNEYSAAVVPEDEPVCIISNTFPTNAKGYVWMK
jgi:hypothetical protein